MSSVVLGGLSVLVGCWYRNQIHVQCRVQGGGEPSLVLIHVCRFPQALPMALPIQA